MSIPTNIQTSSKTKLNIQDLKIALNRISPSCWDKCNDYVVKLNHTEKEIETFRIALNEF